MARAECGWRGEQAVSARATLPLQQTQNGLMRRRARSLRFILEHSRNRDLHPVIVAGAALKDVQVAAGRLTDDLLAIPFPEIREPNAVVRSLCDRLCSRQYGSLDRSSSRAADDSVQPMVYQLTQPSLPFAACPSSAFGPNAVLGRCKSNVQPDIPPAEQ